jgi:hypothetical protein
MVSILLISILSIMGSFSPARRGPAGRVNLHV